MSDRAISEEAMLASLQDIRLPDTAAGGALAEVAAVLGLAALAGLALAALLTLLSRRRAVPRATGSEDMDRLAALPVPERRTALLHLLRARAPERYESLRGDLYAPGGGPDVEVLEAEVRRLA